MNSLWTLNRYFARYKRYLVGGTLFIAISNIFAILPAQIVRYAFDLVQHTISLYFSFEGLKAREEVLDLFSRSIVVYGVLILVMALLRGFFLFLMRQTIIVMSRHIEYDQKNDLYAHYQTLPASFYRSQNTGDLMARISEDVSRVRMYTGPAIMYGINLVVLFVMVIGYMISISPRLTLWSLVPLPFLSVTIYLVNTLINKKSEEIQRSLSNLSTFVQEAFSGIRVIKAFAREADSSRNFAGESEVYRQKSLSLANTNALFFPVMLGMIGLSTILTVYVGGLEVAKGSITTGVIAEFIIYVNMLTWPVTSLGWITSIAQRAAVSQTRIDEFLDQKSNLTSTHNLKIEINGEIEFRNVSFRYKDGVTDVVDNVSFHLKAGHSVAVLGHTGSGKTTLVNLIGRVFDASAGQVLIDGRPIAEYEPQALRAQMGFVPQDVFLFSDTLAKNIAFGRPQATMDEIIKASKDADLHENIERFPDGYKTIVGERGITLSGGQKQRTSIARALLLSPRIMVLDDSLSAVDTSTENTILQNLERIMQGRTTVIVSHRVSSAKLADTIIVLEQGRIAEQGTHQELMERQGLYADLYEKQMEAVE